MKARGALLLVLGILLGVFALNMDTSVATEAQTIGGVSIPSVRVNNLGLMDERRNYLLVSGLLVLVGAGLTIADNLKRAAVVDTATVPVSRIGIRQCPYCAEDIKAEAVLCRFCGREMTPEPEAPVADIAPADASVARTATKEAPVAAKGQVPRHIKVLYREARDRYGAWAAAEDPDAAFLDEEETAAARDSFLDAIQRVAVACEGEDPSVAAIVAARAPSEFARAASDTVFESAMDQLRAR